MNYDKAKARLEAVWDHDGTSDVDAVFTVITQLLETVEILERRLDELESQMLLSAGHIARLARCDHYSRNMLDKTVSPKDTDANF